MTRKLALLLVVCLGFWHGAAQALGLGEIAVDSGLNQRFDARIALRNPDGLGPNEIIAGLASAEDFDRVGVERFFFLSDLQFRSDLSDPARPAIIVSSSQPITEPFVNFVVEVMWPSGRLLREYTVLLDPPSHAARPLSPARTVPGDGQAARPGAAPSTSSSAPAPAPAPSSAPRREAPQDGGGRGTLSGSSYGVTDRDDTLWEVALTVRPESSLSVQQTMLALVRLNPEAFIGGNINQLKAGYVLRVPDAPEIRRLSFDDAVIQVAQQNDRWRRGLDREPLDARDTPSGARPAAASSDGELRLVAAEDGARGATQQDSVLGSDASADGEGAAGGASAAELSEARAAAEALRDQLAESEARAAELARELELKNEQLARAQQVLAQQLNEPSAPAPQPAAGGGLFGFSWLVIAGALAALVAAVAAVLVMLRRRGDDDDMGTVGSGRSGSDDAARAQLMPALGAADAATAGGAAGAAREDPEEAEDVIGEADVYMVYGRFSEAARVLNAAIDQDPDRADIRLKLLEVCVESGDVDGFNVQAQALSAFADSETIAIADQLAMRLPGAMSSSGDVTDGVVSTGPAADAADGEVSLDFDLATAEAGAPVDLDSLDIDIDLDLDDEDTGDARADGTTDQQTDGKPGPDPDFDLDMDADDEVALDAGELPGIDFGPDRGGDKPDPVVPAPSVARSDADDDDVFGDIEFDHDDAANRADAEVRVDDNALDKTQMLDSEAVRRALADDASGAPGEVSDEDFEFDIDDLSDIDTDTETMADIGSPGAAGTPAAGNDFGLDDPAVAPAARSPGDSDDAVDDLAALGLEPDGSGDDATLPAGAELDRDRTVLATSEGDLDFDLDDDDFDFAGAAEGDEISTKLELARAYVDMGDEDGAREILGEVVRDGDDTQKREAGDLLQRLG